MWGGRDELIMWDSSPFAWLEERGPELHLIALIDDATCRIWGRFAAHDSTEANLRALEGRLQRHGRPVAFYTDKHSLFAINRPPQLDEQLRGDPPLTQIGRALRELGIDWIPAHSPQPKGHIERLYGTLQDRLVKQMRLADVGTLEEANRFLDQVFVPFWERRFTVAPRRPLRQPLSAYGLQGLPRIRNQEGNTSFPQTTLGGGHFYFAMTHEVASLTNLL